MRFSEADNNSGHLIEAYGAEGIRVGGRSFRRGLIVTPSRVEEGWGPARAADLEIAHLDALIGADPSGELQVVILGTGATQVFLHPELHAAVLGRGIGLEVMDTGAACRTYNILVSEGRRVVAGLLPLIAASG